ncbi:MAG TPA: ABC transporter permease subunit, partial [Gemmatimonadaceae bacterium]|nr:ABC transporter permease subunit [Gemmatimonadaceae bacterium]
MSGILDSTVAWLTARQLFVRRRLVAAAIVSLVPAIIALIFRLTHAAGADSSEFVTELYRDIVLGTLLPLVAVVFGSASFGGEIEDGTIVYLLVKPLPRWRVVLSKYAVSTAATIAVMVPAIVLPWLVMGVGAVGAQRMLGFSAAIVIGAAIYSALFVMLGLTTKRGLVAGLLYVVVVEFV